MPHPAELAEILDGIQRPGKFYAAGAAEIYLPSMAVEGVGPVAFPLLPFQAEQLVAVAEQAPYGKGPETLVDTAVRKTWQIGAEKIRIQGKYWQQNLGEIVDWVKDKLGVAGRVDAELYKLLVYDTGSFFISHRDTEKAAGMFATLVVVLPSLYEGGELVVRHRGEEAKLALNAAGPSEVAFAAFYADCLHEVLPVTSGCRLALIYNLSRREGGTVAEPPDYRDKQALLAAWLGEWSKEPLAEGGPLKLIYPLEHAYTEAELSFSALKGADANRAAAAVVAAGQAGCDVHLALMSVEESGYAEHSYDGWSSRRRWHDEEDEDEFEIGEVTESERFLSNWRDPEGGGPPFERFPFEDGELCVPDAFEGLEPDELHFQEATGNAGASFERTYRRAALVFWPASRRMAVLSQGGLAASLPYLGGLAGRWAESGEGSDSPLWREAHELAGHMIGNWPKNSDYYRRYDDQPAEAAGMLDALRVLRDAGHIDEFLAQVSAAGDYGLGDNASLIQAAMLLPPPRAAGLVRDIVAANAAKSPSACADLLARCAAAPWPEGPARLAPAAQALFDALPGDPRQPPPARYWERPAAVEPRFVVDLMAGLGWISPALAEHALDRLLSRPATYGFDAVLVPAALALAGQFGPAAARLREACLNHLSRRIAEPLAPPGDWTRPSAVPCSCGHCAELSRFLADPNLEAWSFKAVQQDRSHVEGSIRQAACDLDLRTEKRGSPHTLVCVKNQASYRRRVKQREEDLANQAALRQ